MDGRLASRLPDGVRAAVACRIGIDTRALAALRVALGVLLLADLGLRSLDLVAFYTDAGVLPRAVLRAQYPGLSGLSLHALSGAAWVQGLLFLLAGVVALALAVGYRTRLATALSFMLLVSLHARNPVLLNGGDSVLRRLLFWSVFLPLGERWSVDALRTDREPRRRVANPASAALLVQVVLVYAVNGLFKLRGDLWRRGEAVRYVFSLDRLTVLLGDTLAEFPPLLVAVDRLWLALTVSAVLLVVLAGRARTLLVALFAGMHLGMLLTMRLGLFPLVSIAALLPFLPPSVWDAATARLSGPLRRGVDRARWRDRIERTVPHPGVAVPHTVRRAAARLTPVVVALLLTLVLAWNAWALGYAATPDAVEGTVDPAAYRWDMFAPSPPRADGWYVVPGRLASGRTVDALQRAPVTWERPAEPARTYQSHRWFVYLSDLRQRGNEPLHRPFAAYLCDRWNAGHEDDLRTVTVYYVEQPTRLDGPEPTRRVQLLEHDCAGTGSSGHG